PCTVGLFAWICQPWKSVPSYAITSLMYRTVSRAPAPAYSVIPSLLRAPVAQSLLTVPLGSSSPRLSQPPPRLSQPPPRLSQPPPRLSQPPPRLSQPPPRLSQPPPR